MIIDEVLAQQPQPSRLGGSQPKLTISQATVFAVYHAALARQRGVPASDDELEKAKRVASRAKVSDEEIGAAIVRAQECG